MKRISNLIHFDEQLNNLLDEYARLHRVIHNAPRRMPKGDILIDLFKKAGGEQTLIVEIFRMKQITGDDTTRPPRRRGRPTKGS